MNKIPHTLTGESLTVVTSDFVPRAVPRSHPNWDKIVEVVTNGGSYEQLESLLDIPKAVVSFMEGSIRIEDRVVYYKDQVIDSALTKRILSFMEAGDPTLAKPLIAFFDRVMENPSRRAVQGLYEWLQNAKLPITPDGCILAFKIVRDDYMDCYTGKFDNSVGKTVQVARNEVDEDADRTCSYGLHFCSTEYLPHYGPSNQRVMVVKIDPADVVAFPRDYNTAKGRACKYLVVGEVPKDKAATFFKGSYVYVGFEGPVLAPDPQSEGTSSEPPFDYKAGERYRTRAGKILTVTKTLKSGEYGTHTCQMSDGFFRRPSGQFHGVGNGTSSYDLVERIG